MNLDINELLKQSAKEMVEIADNKLEAKNHKIIITSGVDVIKIREMLGLTRASFCERFGLKIRTVEKWEQNKNKIDSTARSFLTAIANNPKAIEEALR
ncbi:helix-turn-helix domain-containing protein [Francisella salimarina]|uniref:helix-turn-helix domain-containing protein n=1 Tax=Francisella salimarina TaxID=2599927 RepID=UPI003D81652C